MRSPFAAFLLFLVSVSARAETPPARPEEGVLLIGDSLMKAGVGPILKKTFKDRVAGPVDNKAKSGSGLSRPDFWDWPKKAKELLADPRYKTVVMLMGANDCQTVTDASGAHHKFDTPGWRAEYGARVRSLADLLCEGGRKVYWLGLPPMEKASFSKRIATLDEFLETSFAGGETCVRYVPMDVLAAQGGQYAPRLRVNKRRVRVREPDGVHITQSGGMLVADALLRALQ